MFVIKNLQKRRTCKTIARGTMTEMDMSLNRNRPNSVENEGEIDLDSIMRPIQIDFLTFKLPLPKIKSFDNRIVSGARK